MKYSLIAFRRPAIAVMLLLAAVRVAAQHRQHELGMTYLTYPAYYSCRFCHKEIREDDFLPEPYASMKIPFYLDSTHSQTLGYFNGLSIFEDSLKKINQNPDSFFMAKWNEVDTSCISSEIALNNSEDIWHHWLATHEKGLYCLDTSSCMTTDGFYYVFNTKKDFDKGDWQAGMGGRYSDSTLLADKWYKIVLDKNAKHKRR